MKVKLLIEKLSSMPPDAQVDYIWDGAARSVVKKLWLAKDSRVKLYEDGPIYYDEDKPKDINKYNISKLGVTLRRKRKLKQKIT